MNHGRPALERHQSTYKSPFADAIAERHRAIQRIIAKHLELMHAEIVEFDELTLNIETVGDQAEVAHQVLGIVVKRLRDFSSGALPRSSAL